MRIAVFSAKEHDEVHLSAANADAGHDLVFLEPRLLPATLPLVDEVEAVCVFVNDQVDAEVIEGLARRGVHAVLTRSAGTNHIDLAAAEAAGISVHRVPAYSPHAVAEHTLALLLALNRHLHRAVVRVRDRNFSLAGLEGVDLHGRTIGVIGTGTIGAVFAELLSGFGCTVLGVDPTRNEEFVAAGGHYVELDELLRRSFVVSLHCPLTPKTHHLLDAAAFAALPQGALVVNTSRGGLIDTVAAVDALKTGHLGGLAIDVYEEEEQLFFEDRSDEIIQDDVFARLLTFPNVIVTAHQAFFTTEALTNIARTTIRNADAAAAQAGG